MNHERTYRMAGGSLILGEYGYMAELDGWADDCNPCDVIEEEWVLVRSRTLRIGYDELCTVCGGDDYATMDDQGREIPDQCPRCSSTGIEWRDPDPPWTDADDARALRIGRWVIASNGTHGPTPGTPQSEAYWAGWKSFRTLAIAAGVEQ